MLSGLIERDWIVVAIGDTTLMAAKPSLRFLGDGSLSGSTGVNRMFAQYDIGRRARGRRRRVHADGRTSRGDGSRTPLPLCATGRSCDRPVG